jgi:hypothetical protein
MRWRRMRDTPDVIDRGGARGGGGAAFDVADEVQHAPRPIRAIAPPAQLVFLNP